jgi:hypothetical protein
VITQTSAAGTTALADRTSYDVRIRAVNTIDNGAPSPTMVGTTAVVPGAPTDLTVAGGPGQVILDWLAPTDDGGSPITGYRIQRASVNNSSSACPAASDAAWADTVANTGSTDISYVITTTSSTWRCYRVAAINSVGGSAFSSGAGPIRRN